MQSTTVYTLRKSADQRATSVAYFGWKLTVQDWKRETPTFGMLVPLLLHWKTLTLSDLSSATTETIPTCPNHLHCGTKCHQRKAQLHTTKTRLGITLKR